MAKFHPYLYFSGNTEEAFNFYKSIFGGEFQGGIMRYKDMPAATEEAELSEEEGNKVMHVALPIGGDYYLMGTDRLKAHGEPIIVGTNMNICIGPDNEEQTRSWFTALSEGGTIHTQLDNMPWGALYGDLTDKYGVQWMVNFEKVSQ